MMQLMQSIIMDSQLIPDDSKFVQNDESDCSPPNSKETRESGDGDSGAESRDNPESDTDYQALKKALLTITTPAEDGRCKKVTPASKIPIRHPSVKIIESPNNTITEESAPRKICQKADTTMTISPNKEVYEEPILEAPEQFRYPSDKNKGDFVVQVKLPEECQCGDSVDHNGNDNRAETGDTTGRIVIDVMVTRGTEVERSCGAVDQILEELPQSSTVSCSHVLVDNQDNSSSQGIVRHVGSTAPIVPATISDDDTTQLNVVDNYHQQPTSTIATVADGGGALNNDICIEKAICNKGEDEGDRICKNHNECAEGRDAVNVPGSLVLNFDEDACMCAGLSQSTVKPSIESGVARCAQASGCSRVSTATVRAALYSDTLASSCSDSCLEVPAVETPHPAELLTDNQNREIVDRCLANSASDDSLIFQCNQNSGVVEDNLEALSLAAASTKNNLSWKFQNGRLVFESAAVAADENENISRASGEQVVDDHFGGVEDKGEDVNGNEDIIDQVLYSKDLNKRIDESRSRLKYLERKLKEAGITDDDSSDQILNSTKSKCVEVNNDKISQNTDNLEQVVDQLTIISDSTPDYDANQNILSKNSTQTDNHQEATEEIIPSILDDYLCEFDVRQLDTFSGFNSYYQVYDELDDDDDDDEDDDNEDSDYELNRYQIISKTRVRRSDGTAITMGSADGERANKQHNPDHGNLKSLLKRPGGIKTRDVKRSNRVVFNENKNEFFDADYIILIREECDYDDEDDDGVCTCNQHEMVRLTCCEPNCNCAAYDGTGGGGGGGGGVYEQAPQSPKFAPPLEFVDAVTLSPPEGYKDMELGEQQLLALQQMARRGQRAAVCRECSVTHDEGDDDGDGSQSDNEPCGNDASSDHDDIDGEEKEKTDQSQQTTPTSPLNDSDSPNNSQRYILETITMTTVTEQRMLREAAATVADDERKAPSPSIPPGGSPISGILKGGRLWKQQSLETNTVKAPEPQQLTDSSVTSDEEGNNRRSVRFIESESSASTATDMRDSCDGAPDDNTLTEEDNNKSLVPPTTKSIDNCNNSTSPESTEMMLTFKLGNHVLISNNSLKPNSAVRQLFPCTKPPINSNNGKPSNNNSTNTATVDESLHHQYLVTAESLRAFEEAKRSKLPQIIQSGETDESIKRAIERNTLRRSLIRYEPRHKKTVQKTDNSLVERIKQLTCDVDDVNSHQEDEEKVAAEDVVPSTRVSPPGEEARNSPEANHHHHHQIVANNKSVDKSFSPSSSSTASSNSSSMSSTYKKITDLFGNNNGNKKERLTAVEQQHLQMHQGNNELSSSNLLANSLPDLGNGSGPHLHHDTSDKVNTATINESRKQFLSTLAPLTACVSGGVMGNADEYYYHMSNHVGERVSMASSVGTEYSLEDIDEGLKNGGDEESKRIAPDVLVGTPSASESGDELAMFVQQDASRIERIKKKYQPEQQSSNKDVDDEHDDYGFNRRPSVRGIKPRFGSTTEILQQIQSQLQPPPVAAVRVAWPYYSESGLTNPGDNNKSRNINQLPLTNYQNYQTVPADELKNRTTFVPPQYRPTSFHPQDENMYQNCANQRCVREVYKTNVNQTYSTVMKVGGGCNEYYQSLPRVRNGRPQSPPPLELSKNYHQTMVYIPYNHIEGYQPTVSPTPYYHHHSLNNDYARVSNQNQINKQRYIEPIYHQQQQQRIHMDEHHYVPLPKPMVRMPFNGGNNIIPSSRSESPSPGQFSTARATQTPVVTASLPSSTAYYPVAATGRYRPVQIWQQQTEGPYATSKVVNRHSFPSPRYPPADSISLTDSDSQHSGGHIMPNGFRQSVEITFGPAPSQKDSMPNSPTKSRFIERGVPEGAASVSPQDGQQQQNGGGSTMASPTSPQNPPPQQKPLFYAMNV